ncbi:hypothetical protein D9O50_01975 [Oxalobacteraceae bacterium CAVE-383]|nr:hypothetical protein D9O50_01975 [Oxalobacteraceae bacterium CAVE-383]
MDAINKTLAGLGAVAEPAHLPLDEHVKAAWSSADIGVDVEIGIEADIDVDAEVGDCHAALPFAPRSMPAAGRKKERKPEDAAAAVITPQPPPFPLLLNDLAWLPQRGDPAAAKPRPVQRSAATIDAAPAATVTPILAILMPNAAPLNPAKFAPASAGDLPRAGSAVKRPGAKKSQAAAQNTSSISAGEAMPISDKVAPGMFPRSVAAHASVPQSVSAATAASAHASNSAITDAGADAAMRNAPTTQSVSQSNLPAGAGEASETTPFMTLPAVALHKEKRAAQTTEPSQQSILPMPPVLPDAAAASASASAGDAGKAGAAKQQKRDASPANAGKADSIANAASANAHINASSNSSLTYRFDKWNGNHAVTVQTAMPADLPHATAGQTPAQAAAQTSGPAPMQAPNPPNATQYTLSPSDQLVGQRLSEHLTQFGRDAALPQVHLRDADEHRQRQQQHPQPPREDDEDEA